MSRVRPYIQDIRSSLEEGEEEEEKEEKEEEDELQLLIHKSYRDGSNMKIG